MKYRYPFLSADDAHWVAREVDGHIRRVGGTIDVAGAIVVVIVPDHVLYDSLGLLSLFVSDPPMEEGEQGHKAA